MNLKKQQNLNRQSAADEGRGSGRRSRYHFQPLARKDEAVSRYHHGASFKPLSLEGASQSKRTVESKTIKPEVLEKAAVKPVAASAGESLPAREDFLDGQDALPTAKKIGLKQAGVKLFSYLANRIKLFWTELRNQSGSHQEAAVKVELLREDLMAVRSALPEFFKLIGIIFTVVIFTGLMWGYDTYLEKQHVGINLERQKRLDYLNKTIADMRQKQTAIEESNSVVKTVYNLLAKRIYWPEILAKIESLTLKNVYYNQLKIDGNLVVSLMARAATINDALQQINVWESATDCVSDVEVSRFDLREEIVTVESLEDIDQKVGLDTGGVAGASETATVAGTETEAVKTTEGLPTFTKSYIEFPVRLQLNRNCFGEENAQFQNK